MALCEVAAGWNGVGGGDRRGEGAVSVEVTRAVAGEERVHGKGLSSCKYVTYASPLALRLREEAEKRASEAHTLTRGPPPRPGSVAQFAAPISHPRPPNQTRESATSHLVPLTHSTLPSISR